MTVVVNGQTRTLRDGVTVGDLVAEVGRDPSRAGAAVAVNGEVVTRREWATRPLRDGDRVEVLGAVQGG